MRPSNHTLAEVWGSNWAWLQALGGEQQTCSPCGSRNPQVGRVALHDALGSPSTLLPGGTGPCRGLLLPAMPGQDITMTCNASRAHTGKQHTSGTSLGAAASGSSGVQPHTSVCSCVHLCRKPAVLSCTKPEHTASEKPPTPRTSAPRSICGYCVEPCSMCGCSAQGEKGNIQYTAHERTRPAQSQPRATAAAALQRGRLVAGGDSKTCADFHLRPSHRVAFFVGAPTPPLSLQGGTVCGANGPYTQLHSYLDAVVCE